MNIYTDCEVSEADIQAECVILQCGAYLCVTWHPHSYPAPSLCTGSQESKGASPEGFPSGQIHNLLNAKRVSKSQSCCSQAGRLCGAQNHSILEAESGSGTKQLLKEGDVWLTKVSETGGIGMM